MYAMPSICCFLCSIMGIGQRALILCQVYAVSVLCADPRPVFGEGGGVAMEGPPATSQEG